MEFIREANQRGSTAPIILLTGWDSLETDIQAMKEGASDYLVKNEISPSMLERSIRYAIERDQKTRELHNYKNHLEEMVEERTASLVEAREKAENWAKQLIRDIAERTRTEEALRQSERRLNHAQQIMTCYRGRITSIHDPSHQPGLFREVS